MGGVPQISPGVDIQRLSPLSQTSPFQHGGNTDDDICQQHVDTDAEAREDDQNCATEDASLDYTDETKIQANKIKATKKEEGTEKVDEKDEKGTTDKETDEGSEQDSKKDQDSDVSFQEDADEEIDAIENEEEWIEYIKKSTKEAEEHMEKQTIRCWIEVHRKQKWRMARRIISLPEKRWNRRVFNWHPGLDTSIKARRNVGRPKRRWEDDLNEFMKNRRWTRERQIWSEEQQQCDGKHWRLQNMERKWRNFFQELEGIRGRKTKQFVWAFLPKPSSTVCDRLIDVHCCAATCVHELVCGDGRHLADHLAELPQELPQVGTRRTTTKTIQNHYKKQHSGGPRSPTTSPQHRDWAWGSRGDDKLPHAWVLFPVPGHEGYESHCRLDRVAEQIHRGCTDLLQLPPWEVTDQHDKERLSQCFPEQEIEGYDAQQEEPADAKVLGHEAYLTHHTDEEGSRDEDRCDPGRKWATLTKLIREFISGEDFVKRMTRIRKANIRAFFLLWSFQCVSNRLSIHKHWPRCLFSRAGSCRLDWVFFEEVTTSPFASVGQGWSVWEDFSWMCHCHCHCQPALCPNYRSEANCTEIVRCDSGIY